MKKQCCTVFLLLVLTIQILPIRQMGSLLFSNQFTEELPHSIHLEKSGFQKAFLKHDFFAEAGIETALHGIDREGLHHSFTADIPQNFSVDIHVPPPNC